MPIDLGHGITVLENPAELIDWFDDFAGDQPYRFLSNFYEAPIHIDLGYGPAWYATNEHAFQAAKASTKEAHDVIRHAVTPGHSKALGRRTALRPDWEQVKTQVMMNCCWAKFTQHPDLAARLLATGTARLVEGTLWHDRVWGVDLVNPTRPGENRLGIILEEIRAELKKAVPA